MILNWYVLVINSLNILVLVLYYGLKKRYIIKKFIFLNGFFNIYNV